MTCGKAFMRSGRFLGVLAAAGLIAVSLVYVGKASMAQEQPVSNTIVSETITVPLAVAVSAENDVKRVFVGRLEPLRAKALGAASCLVQGGRSGVSSLGTNPGITRFGGGAPGERRTDRASRHN